MREETMRKRNARIRLSRSIVHIALSLITVFTLAFMRWQMTSGIIAWVIWGIAIAYNVITVIAWTAELIDDIRFCKNVKLYP